MMTMFLDNPEVRDRVEIHCVALCVEEYSRGWRPDTEKKEAAKTGKTDMSILGVHLEATGTRRLAVDTQSFPLSSTQTFQIVKGLVQILPVTPQVPSSIVALFVVKGWCEG